MNEILKRLNVINKELEELRTKEGEVYTILRNRRRSERDGIVFTLKHLGLNLTNNPYTGWTVWADGK